MDHLKVLLFILILGLQIICKAQSEKVGELLYNSIVPYNTEGEFSRSFIEKIKEELRDVRVVALGEASHEDGSTFEHKVNLVKLLHRELGFEVLAFEYGFYGNWLSNENLRSGGDISESTKYAGWSKSVYAFPVYKYMAESHKTDFPLQYAGFDSEKVPDGIPNIIGLITQVSHVLDIEMTSTEKALLDSLITAVYGGMGNKMKDRLTFDQRIRAKQKIQDVHESWLENRSTLPDSIDDTQFTVWAYTLQSVLMDEKKVYAGSFHNIVRDKHMAERIIMLADSIYKGKKIILWGASGHFARNMVSIQRNLPEGSYGYFPYYQTGDWLYEHFGKGYYSIAFVAGQGSIGTIYPEGHKFKKYEAFTEIKNLQPGSFESAASQTGSQLLFTSLRNQPGGSWLNNRPFRAYPLGYQEDNAPWPEVFDAFFFIKNMKPDRWLDQN